MRVVHLNNTLSETDQVGTNANSPASDLEGREKWRGRVRVGGEGRGRGGDESTRLTERQ